MPRARILPILVIIILISIVYGVSCKQDDTSASVSDIKLHPQNYDGKVVRINGWLASGHVGVLIESENRQDAIRLRSPDEVDVAAPLQVQRDDLLNKFWKLVETEIRDTDSKGIHVELDGLVRTLKKDGKPAQEFDVYGQWPIEIITLRIREIIEE
jgi:hypothetical protein